MCIIKHHLLATEIVKDVTPHTTEETGESVMKNVPDMLYYPWTVKIISWGMKPIRKLNSQNQKLSLNPYSVTQRYLSREDDRKKAGKTGEKKPKVVLTCLPLVKIHT